MDESGGWASHWFFQGCVKGNVECPGCEGAISVLGGGEEFIRGLLDEGGTVKCLCQARQHR